ncbi:HNH endonuclease [Tabrizicola sp.]|uniref:HNH endonuclease n=1 Tax=Tabrizicola sp. TaxID=2005166 RepID=UPI0035AF2584
MGITDAALLRASHIKPWADCTTTEERLDPMNGLPLASGTPPSTAALSVSPTQARSCTPPLSYPRRADTWRPASGSPSHPSAPPI